MQGQYGQDPLTELPLVKDVFGSPQKREALFLQKLQLCSQVFAFEDPSSEQRAKDNKRQTLMELLDYVQTPGGEKMFAAEPVQAAVMATVTANICRALPPQSEDFDPDEDEPVLDLAWPHLHLVYEFFLRFVVSNEVNAKAAKKHVSHAVCAQLVELFDSEDPRERDYLKTILHRIYGKFMNHRSFIRKAIGNVFFRFVYETERHNGVGELLEILGSIINGFAVPLKKEHLSFLERVLMPLHKPKCVALYHQQLSYCIVQYIEKEPDTVAAVLDGLARFWPWSCSSKQVLFLNELEDILELIGAEQLPRVQERLFRLLARCLASQHFQVAERTLFLWNNEHLKPLSRQHAAEALPRIFEPLHRHGRGHWNATVEGLAQNVLKMYMDYDPTLYGRILSEHEAEAARAAAGRTEAARQWDALEGVARQKRTERERRQQQRGRSPPALPPRPQRQPSFSGGAGKTPSAVLSPSQSPAVSPEPNRPSPAASQEPPMQMAMQIA